MSSLSALGHQFQSLFPATENGRERGRWFILTLQAILVPITASRTSNLLRAIETLFGVRIAQSRYYTFMASVKLPWVRLWELLWRAIPAPLTDGRLLLALDDSINAKTGRKVFACQRSFDHAAKTNQSPYPWAQTIVTVGLLKRIHGRWSCVPLAFAFYLRRQTLSGPCIRVRGRALVFQTKFAQAVALIARLATVFAPVPILVVTDSWFGNAGLLKSLRAACGPQSASAPARIEAPEGVVYCGGGAVKRQIEYSILEQPADKWDARVTVNGETRRAMTAHSFFGKSKPPRGFVVALLGEDRSEFLVFKDGDQDWLEFGDYTYRKCN